MKFEVGKKLYRIDDKGNTKTFVITDIVYKIDGTTRKYMSEDDLDEFIRENEIVTDTEEVKRIKIKRLENELDIKLKEV